MGRIARGGAVACLWLWTSAGSLSAAGTADPSPAMTYQSALERFNRGDYARAMDLLEHLPAIHNAHVQADRLNLKGAILSRERRDDDARAAFAEAARLDPGLLAAHFNAVEISFREKRYAESHRQFAELLAQMGKGGHATERRFIEYKLMLGDLLDGKEKPALDFIAAHRADEQPPLAWFYLNAALERQHGRESRADAWVAQASAHYAPVAEQVFADSFAELGWTPRAGAVADRVASSPREDRVHPPAVPPAKAATQVVTLPALPVSAPPAQGKIVKQAAAKDVTAQVAVVSLFPANHPAPSASVPVRENAHADEPRPAFHFDNRPAPRPPVIEEMPPSEVGLVSSLNPSLDPAHPTSAAADVFAKSSSGRKGHASPSPSASPADGESTSSSPLPSPDASATPASKADATPSGTPSPAFVQKYEAAMVQFLQKDLVGAIKLLDEADAIQGNEPQAVALRNQIFKSYYEAAYAAYQHADYPAALTQLDGADAAHSNAQNQSDAYNLRGLVLSKQRNYEGAESMFHKAVQTDPGLWAAKFNYAEVPFNYRNFTVARARFEELFSQTDPVKQPVEAELTQFKVFLTLLLEGKEDAARTFMQHFNFSGATPARYFCQAALNFYSGDVDKAQGWIDSARKEYPPRKSSSFLEAFYRVGWLTDPNTPETAARASTAAATPSPTPAPTTAVAAATPSPTPAPMAAATPKPAASATPTASPVLALQTPPVVPAFRVLVTPPPVASATPAATASPSATLVAKATPSATPSPSATPVLMAKASATPTLPPTASATPAPTALAKATPSATPAPSVSASPSPALVKVTPTASPTATPAPAVAKASATPSPTASAPAVVKASATPSATASATALAVASPKPTATLPAVAAAQSPSPAPSASATASESPEATASETGEQAGEQNTSGAGDFLRVVVVSGVALYFLYVISRIGLAAANRKSKPGPTADASTSSQKTKEAEEVEVKR